MEIKKIDIEYFKKDAMASADCENVKHIKILPYLSIVQSVEGSYDISLGNGETEQTGEGGFFVAPSGIQQTIVHHISKKSGRMSNRWIFIDVIINGHNKLDSLYRFPTVIKNKDISKYFDELFAADDLCDEYACCYKIIGKLLEAAIAADEKLPAAIKRSVDYIIKNYEKKITVEELSKIATMSEPNFYASFKRYIGVPPITYLNRYRLSLAAEKLVNTEMSVGEISGSVGVKDPLYFSKLFKKTYGVTPGKYRENHIG